MYDSQRQIRRISLKLKGKLQKTEKGAHTWETDPLRTLIRGSLASGVRKRGENAERIC